ncbi:MAG: protein phosphatase 2C domain-containing protein [Clostridiales Family XIII bacterium]|jgi:serine/threonine protein phosphatase PrpC|nr:protein phosphatase 2C domain-containing protein [Clostridiales Family XIII bacterium]
MSILAAACTDVGTRKNVNQDSYGFRIADTAIGEVAFAVVCDGMGGLAQGEYASAGVTLAFLDWFERDFPYLVAGLRQDGFASVIGQWRNLINDQNLFLIERGRQCGADIGTTLTAGLFACGAGVLIGHVGDSRTYRIANGMEQLTEDHTFVENEVKNNRMTPEQAFNDPRRNILLQCIGVNHYLSPLFVRDLTQISGLYLLCSDGFRHQIGDKELFRALADGNLRTEDDMRERLRELTAENIRRGEVDNITSVLLRIQ